MTERHRHRYEANVNYLDILRQHGLLISAMTQREQLTEIVELPKSVHPWFIGVQFHPEFKSTPGMGIRCSMLSSKPHSSTATAARISRPSPDETLRF